MSRHLLFTLFALLVGLSAGCGGSAPSTYPTRADGDGVGQLHREAQALADGAPAVQRKIIYSGTVEVIVKDLDATVAEVERIVADHKGYVAKEVTGTIGTRRTATWTLKVPA